MFLSLSSRLVKECYATFVFAHGIVLAGSVCGFSAFLIPRLTEEKIITDVNSVSWIGSSACMISAIASVAFSIAFGILGRLRNFQFAFLIYITGYLILLFAPNVQFIYLASGINAVAVVICLPTYATFVSETYAPKRRGLFMSMDGVLETIGISMDYILNSFLPWRVIAAICVVISTLGLLQSFFVPETSYWYLIQGQVDLAKKSMLWFQPNLPSHEVDSHIEGMINSIKRDSETKANRRSFCSMLCKIKYFKPFFLGSILSMLCAGAGRPIVISYTVNVFKALNTPYNSEMLATWFGVADFIGSISCLVIVYKYNRLICFYIFSSIAVTSLSITIAYQFYVSAHENSVPYLPVIGLFTYNMIMSSGFYAIVYVIVIEMQFAEFRGQVMSFAFFLVFAMGFLYSKFFPYVNEKVKIHYIFLIFLFNIVLTVILVFFFATDNTEKLFYETGALKNEKKKQETIPMSC